MGMMSEALQAFLYTTSSKDLGSKAANLQRHAQEQFGRYHKNAAFGGGYWFFKCFFPTSCYWLMSWNFPCIFAFSPASWSQVTGATY